MTQDELDAQCEHWKHGDRKVVWCANPLCPGKSARELVALDDVPDVTDELAREPDESPKPA